MGKEWKFEQLGGQQRVLTLSGASAPHGRERKDPIVKDGAKLRRHRQFYSGNDVPTTHIFGVLHEDWTLKGRFQDTYLGRGGTKQAISNWLQFLKDGQPLRVSWGDVMSVEAILDVFTPGRESESHATYEIVLLIDARDEFKTKVTPLRPSPTALCAAIREFIAGDNGIADKAHEGGSLSTLADSITEGIGDVVGSLNSVSAALVDISQGFDDFASGTIGQLERLKAGAQQMRTAAIKLINTLNDAFDADVGGLAFSDADADIQWSIMRAGIEADVNDTMALLADLDREVDIAQRGRVVSVYVAINGDTWESIAAQIFGGADKAGALRDANGARYGELPVAGRTYQIPAG